MAGIVHGTITAPTGVTATGVLLHKKRTQVTDKKIESPDYTGLFAAGKSIEVETKITLSGECLTTAAFSAVGSGEKSAAAPKIESLTREQSAEAAETFEIEAVYVAAGEGLYGPNS